MGAFHKFMFGTGRFLAYYPCIFWAIRAVPLFRTICKHPLPADIPHRREIYISQGSSAVLSVFLTLWMLPTGIWVICGSIKRKGSWLIVYCIVDLGLTVLMIASLIWQSFYLPKTLNSCHHAETWQVVGNETSLFFSTAKENGPPCGPGDTCYSFVLAWLLSIVVLILFGLSAIYPLLNIPIPWPLVWFYGHVRQLWKVSGGGIQRLSKLIRSSLKNRFGTEQGIEMQSWRQTRKATLFDVLNDDVGGRTIISLAQELHYSDIVSLSLASKEIHKAIYCSRTPGEQTERLYMAICKDSKSECWCCGIQICRFCKHSMLLPEPASRTHIDNCEPYCSACYYKILCRRYVYGPPKPSRSYSYGARKTCACRASRTERALDNSNVKRERHVCRFCFALDRDEALAVREAREMGEIKHLVMQQLRCVVCTRGLKNGGLRWWGCSLCERECVSDFHPTWDKKKR